MAESNLPTSPIQAHEFVSAFVPPSLWAKDHWSTLAYMETVMVECAGFQVGLDPRMRSSRRHVRVMNSECPRPKRPVSLQRSLMTAMAMDTSHGTRLKDGRQVPGHDDWSCVQDMAEVGLFDCLSESVKPGVVINLSELGRRVVNALREHKAGGGNFATFDGAALLELSPA